MWSTRAESVTGAPRRYLPDSGLRRTGHQGHALLAGQRGDLGFERADQMQIRGLRRDQWTPALGSTVVWAVEVTQAGVSEKLR